ncbi:methylmalonyl-CoA mutase family protein [Neobacillus pocheonensis]|uniref:Methylmalonyl-CoA mutase family protein n=1 Tax=Neobacillus pocheonensis TaxID=363869 RepID=A0ABT0W5X2_9BACI|nr:methylmalonyl-CoA mutase family protein [Neobacillus pocheonensis]
MGLAEMKNQSFPRNHIDDWERKAEESIKGKPIESLQNSTYENIVLKPLYSQEDEKLVSAYPAGSDFRRGIESLGYTTNKWKVAQRIPYKTIEELQVKLEQAFARGQTVISFEMSKELLEKRDLLEKLLKAYICEYPLAINASGSRKKC